MRDISRSEFCRPSSVLVRCKKKKVSRWWFQIFFIFTPTWAIGEDSHFD